MRIRNIFPNTVTFDYFEIKVDNRGPFTKELNSFPTVPRNMFSLNGHSHLLHFFYTPSGQNRQKKKKIWSFC